VVPKLAVVAVIAVAALPSTALGGTVSVNAALATLVFTASAGEANDVQLSESAGTITITDSGAVISPGAGCAQVSDHEATCTGANQADVYLGDLDDTAASSLVQPVAQFFFGEGGGDHLTLCALCRGVIFGGTGADTLELGDKGGSLVGEGGADTLIGGASYDGIDGGPGADTIYAGRKRDSITPGGGDDFVDGGPGWNSVSFVDHARQPGVVVDLRLGTATGRGTKTLVRIQAVTGTNHPDKLYGTNGRNRLDGLSGADVIVGRGGADNLVGSSGHDRIYGGSAYDQLWGGFGSDLLSGGPAPDHLHSSARPKSPVGTPDGRDRAFGRAGDDEFYARDGVLDVLRGGRGADKARVDRRLDVTRSIKVVPLL
jgi:Ca2+-binding RTX toxin-like protein